MSRSRLHILLARGEFRRDNILMRIAFRIILVLILAGIVVGVIVAATSLDGIVKTAAETFGPQLTKVSVKLDSVHIVLFTGSARVTGLVVGNPEGYKAPQAISVGLAEVGVNPFSILSDKIVIRAFHVVSPEITFEGGLHGNNLSKILENVEDFQNQARSHPLMPRPRRPRANPARRLKWMILSSPVPKLMCGLPIWVARK